MKRWLVALLAAVMLVSFCAVTAFAHDVPQDRDDCVIEIGVAYDGKPVSGGTLTAIRVGFVDSDDGNFFFSRVGDDLKLDDVQSVSAVSDLFAYYEAQKSSVDFETETVAVQNGSARFTGLSTGLYLIVQKTPATGYSKLSSFLVGVPYLQDGVYVYELSADAKTSLEREPEEEPKPDKPTPPTLPQTGQLNWPVPVLACAGVFLMAFGWLLRFGRKKEDYET